MDVVSKEALFAAIAILGKEGIDDDEIDVQISKLVDDPMTARRLADWPPEVFGLVFISHSWNLHLLLKVQSSSSGRIASTICRHSL